MRPTNSSRVVVALLALLASALLFAGPTAGVYDDDDDDDNGSCPCEIDQCRCSGDPSALHAQRQVAIQRYFGRVSGDLANYIDTCRRYYTDDAVLDMRGVGRYQGLVEVEEYGYVLFEGVDGVRTIGMELTPDNATFEWSTSEVGAAAGDINDTVALRVNMALYVNMNPTTGAWATSIGGIRNTHTLTFGACSDRLRLDFVVQPPEVVAFYLAANRLPPAAVCANIMARCTGPLAAYGSLQECLAFMAALDGAHDPRAACPYALSSNTTACRNYHAGNAVADPTTHCPHTEVESMTCVDECHDTCGAVCPPNAHYAAVHRSDNADDVVYRCDCDDGFVVLERDADSGGAAACVPATCQADWQCADAPNTALCNVTAGRCACRPTFVWDTATGSCRCPSGSALQWDLGAGSPYTAPACIPLGRCTLREHCTAQEWSSVQCRDTTPPALLTPGIKACLCNPGFEGGYELPCTCPHGAAAIQWSNALDGNVCLAPGQCTDNWHCTWPQTCQQQASTGATIGHCAAPA